MFSTKNISPQQLSAFTALIISVPVALGIYLLHPTWWAGLLALALFLAEAICYSLQRFIYRKTAHLQIHFPKASNAKNFYKNILPEKASRK
jgi:two-component system phosphate regulon sensor histidine kinase PhoR